MNDLESDIYDISIPIQKRFVAACRLWRRRGLQIEKLEKEINDIKRNLATEKENYVSCRLRAETGEADVVACEEDAVAYKEEIIELEQRIEELKDTSSRREVCIAELKQDNRVMHLRIKELKAKLKKRIAEAENVKLHMAVAASQTYLQRRACLPMAEGGGPE